MRNQSLTLLALGAAFGLSSCGEKSSPAADESAEIKPLVFSAIPDEKVSDQDAKFQAMAKYLSATLEVPVEFSISADYNAAVQRFKNGEVHLVWFGGLSGVQARDAVEGAEAIAQGAEDPKYKSYFIAHSSTGLAKSDEFPAGIKEFSFTFGSPQSTSGRLMPTWFIKQFTQQTPEEFFTQPVQFQTSGGHHSTAKAVESGSVQVGALSYKKYDSMVADGELDPTKAVIIWETPFYADYNFTAHPELNEIYGDGFTNKLQKALIECSDAEALNAVNRSQLIEANNEEFEGIRVVAQELEMLR